jgi:hypothetical protein
MIQKKNKHFKSPHTIRKEWGDLWVEIELNTPVNFKNTAAAMDEVSKAGEADDSRKSSKGINNYSNSTLNLMNALDTFTTECPNTINGAGKEINYDFSDPSDFTVFLIWIMRNQQSHNGGVVNEKTKSRYENAIQKYSTKPLIDLPGEIEVGTKFEIQYDDYFLLKKCVFNYIGKRIPDEDLEVLKKRSSINLSPNKPIFPIEVSNGIILLDWHAAREHFERSPKGGILIPENISYDSDSGKMIMPNGDSFSAEFMKNSSYTSNPKDACTSRKSGTILICKNLK